MLILLFIFIITLQQSLVQGLEILYYRDFQNNFSCDSVFTTDIWRMVSGTYSSSDKCNYQCERSDNNNNVYFLAPEMKDYPSGMQIKKSFSQPYSIFGVDIVYMNKIDPISFSMYDGSSKIIQGDYNQENYGNKVEYNYEIYCTYWSGWMKTAKEVIQVNNKISSSEIILKVKQTVTSSRSWYGTLKIRLWANCVENCQACKSQNECNKCLPGFKRYTLTSGQQVCEQTHNCNISNCFSCIKSSPSSSATCVKCLPGYSLNSSSACVAISGSCTTGKYQSGSGCVSYSTNCYLQQQNTNINWVACYGLTVSDYKCLNTEEILIFEHRNYQLFTCGCRIEFCLKCPNNGSCSQCFDGYTFNNTTKKCETSGCPVLYTQDPFTGECLKNCEGSFCKECDPDKCLVCLTENYYITSANPENCQLCSITNCLKCSGDGLCQKCANMFQLSTDKQSCTPCNVSKCVQCESGQPGVCKICTDGYLLSSDKKSCTCGVQNCTTCNADNGGICDYCVTGYLISNDQSKCTCESKNCQVCNTTNGSKCDTCYPGYSHDLTTFKCKCAVENCGICNVSNGALCDTCMTNYFPINTQSSTCLCQVQNCQKCSSINGSDCATCSPNYISQKNGDNNECKCSVENCKTCNSADGSICDICVDNYFQNTAKTSCSCDVQGCKTCNLLDGKICTQCNPSYELDQATGKCVCQFKNCKKCKNDDGNICEDCVDGYKRDTNQRCVCSVENCSQCNLANGNICDTCVSGYNASQDQKKCECGVENCITCDISDGKICSVCVQGYLTNKCLCTVKNCQKCKIDDGSKCETCINNYTSNTQNNTCDCSVDKCSVCNPLNGNICDQPYPGYEQDPNTGLYVCSFKNCKKCKFDDGNICEDCVDGYKRDANQKCVCSVENCSQCNLANGNICDTCVSGYNASQDQKKCGCGVENCITCDVSDGKICSVCVQGYLTNKCLCSVKNCQKCKIDNGSTCDTCINNYTSNTQNNTCNCAVEKCTICNPLNGNICDKPYPGYELDPQSGKYICSFKNCKKCKDDDGNICEDCVNGYKRDNAQNCVCSLQNCLKCNINDGSICDQCIQGYEKKNNQCICNIQNCQKCNSNNGLKCDICVLNFKKNTLNNQQDSCDCAVNNCKSCNPQNGSECSTCDVEYEVNPQNLCVSTKCKVTQCIKCLKYEPDKCDTCASSYIVKDNKCSLKEKNYFEVLEPEVIENIGYNVTVKFDQKIVVLNENYNDVISVQILDYKKPFQTNFIQTNSDNLIKLQLTLNENCKDKKLMVKMHDPNFIQINNLYVEQKQVDLKDYVIKTPEQKQQIEATKQVTQAAASTLTNTMILLVILGNSYVLFSTIDLTTFIYFLLYINVRYPENMISFCGIFQNFQFAFIPNAIQVFLIDPVGYSQPYTPSKFIENGADAYFLNGAGQSFTIIFGIMSIYGILKLLTLVPIPSVKVYVLSKIKSGWEYCGFLDLIGCVYMYVLVSVLLQFYCFEFTESISFVSYSLFGFCFIAVFFIPVWMAIFITTCKDLNDPNIQIQYASLIGGLKIQMPLPQSDSNNADNAKIMPLETNQEQFNDVQQNLTKQEMIMYKYSRYTNVFLYFRKLIYAIIVIFLYDMVYLQMVLISIMNILLAYFYLYIRPQEGKYDNIRNGISEIFLIIIQITVCLLVEDNEDQDEQERYNIGWVIISCASLILFMHIFNVILDLLKAVFNLIKDFISTLFKSQKELEKIKLEKLGDVGSENKLFGTTTQMVFKQMRSMNKKLSTIIVNNVNNSSGKLEINPIKKLKVHALMVKSAVKLNKKEQEAKNNDEKIQDQDDSKLKQNDQTALGISCVSPFSKMSILSNRNLEQSGINNNQSLTFNQMCSSRLKASIPQSLNASANDLNSHKTSSMLQLY